MVEVLATINTTEKSVGRVCNYLTNRRVKHRVVSSGDNMQIKLLTTRSEISAINRFLEKEGKLKWEQQKQLTMITK